MAVNNPSKMLKCEGTGLESDEEMNIETGCEIDALNDDCLLHIINFIHNPRDLISVEKVCKRWKRIVSSPMAWRKVNIKESDSNDFLEEILKKCGERVIDLSIESQSNFTKGNLMELISEYCKKLLYLGVSFPGFFDTKDLNLLKYPFIKNLKYLDLYDLENWCHEDDDALCLGNIVAVLDGAKNLKHLKIGDAYGKKISIKYSGKKIKITNFDPRDEILKQIFRRFPGLADLKVGFDQCEIDNFLLSDALVPIQNSLTSLELIDIKFGSFNGDGLKKLQLINLKKLVIIECSELTDDILSIFIQNCPSLEEIYLCDNEKLTDAGYEQLGSLKNLIKLSFGLTEVPVSTLAFLAQHCNKLQEIYCLNLSGSVVSELKKIVDYLPNLKLIRMKNLKDFTKESIALILHVVQQRNNNVQLNIEFIDGTTEDAKQLELTEKRSLSSEPHNGLTVTVLGLETAKDLEDYDYWKRWLIYLNKKFIQRRMNPRWCRYYTL